MNFRSDSQRRAMFANIFSKNVHNSFSSKKKLYHGTSDVFKTSIEDEGLLPETEVSNPSSWDSNLRRDESSISLTDEPATAIVYGALKSDAMGFPNKDIVVFETEVPMEKLDPDEHTTKQFMFPATTTEESLDEWHVASTKEFPLPTKRAYEFPADIREDDDVKEFKVIYFDHPDSLFEQFGHLDKKNKVAGRISKRYKFSFKSRRDSDYYPKDFNAPDNFPDIIRTYVSDIMQSKQFKSESGDIHYDMNDSRDISIMNGMVNQSLAENWNPEWGVKPSGRYLKADVEDAMEDLM